MYSWRKQKSRRGNFELRHLLSYLHILHITTLSLLSHESNLILWATFMFLLNSTNLSTFSETMHQHPNDFIFYQLGDIAWEIYIYIYIFSNIVILPLAQSSLHCLKGNLCSLSICILLPVIYQFYQIFFFCGELLKLEKFLFCNFVFTSLTSSAITIFFFISDMVVVLFFLPSYFLRLLFHSWITFFLLW